LTTFRRIIFPSLRPALLAGMALAFARAIGEIGSLVLISGNLPFKTQTDPLLILGLIESGATTSAAAVSVSLLVIALGVLLGIGRLTHWSLRHDR
jgi:sulfate transport system permease protein